MNKKPTIPAPGAIYQHNTLPFKDFITTEVYTKSYSIYTIKKVSYQLMKYKVVLQFTLKHVYNNNEADHCTFNFSATTPQLSVEMTVN